MKPIPFFIAAIAVLVSPVSAQLVHLTLNGTVSDQFGGESWQTGGGTSVGQSATLHLFYDPNLPAQASEPAFPEQSYRSNSAANNFWRLNFGDVDVSMAFDTITVSDFEMTVYGFEGGSLTSLDPRLVFAEDPSPGLALPVLPLPALAAVDPMNPFETNPSRFVFDTQNGFGLEAGSLFVDVESLRAESVPRFMAVPEPGTYAAAAGLLLLAAVVRRRVRLKPSASAQ